MNFIAERTDVQNKVIEILQSVGWEYISLPEIQEKRAFNIRESFLIDILEQKLKELN